MPKSSDRTTAEFRADEAEPPPAALDAANQLQATGRVSRRNQRGTAARAETALTAALTAEGTDGFAAESLPNRGTLAASDGAHSSDDSTGDVLPERVWNALLAHPGATAAELASAAGAGRSTVSKLLATWTEQGRATSAAGANTRAARLWTATPTSAVPTSQPERHADAEQPNPRARRRGPAAEVGNRIADTSAGVDRSLTDSAAGGRGRRRTTGSPVGDVPVGDVPVGDVPVGDVPVGDVPVDGVPVGDVTGTVRSAAPAHVAGANRTGSARLAAGELRGQVEQFLAEHPGEHGPVEVGHGLRRSSGAVANALERLVETGWATRTSERPKRYRYADEPDTGKPDGDGAEDGVVEGGENGHAP